LDLDRIQLDVFRLLDSPELIKNVATMKKFPVAWLTTSTSLIHTKTS